MALQGTIESFPIIDVLRLLNGAGHAGLLTVVGERGRAEMWLHDGTLLGGRFNGREQLDASTLVVQVLRNSTGEFIFENQIVPSEVRGAMPSASIADAVAAAEVSLAEWHSIEKVIPSTSHRLRLSTALKVEQVSLDRQQWALVVSASRQPAASEAAAELGMDDLAACRLAVQLVDMGLVVIEEPIDSPEPFVQVESSHDDRTMIDSHVVAEMVVDLATQGASKEFVDFSGVEIEIDGRSHSIAENSEVEAADETSAEDAESVTSGFPDRFPIDDLLGGGPDDEWDTLSDPLPPVVTDPFSQTSFGAETRDNVIATDPLPDVEADLGAPSDPGAPAASSGAGDMIAGESPALVEMTFAGLPDPDRTESAESPQSRLSDESFPLANPSWSVGQGESLEPIDDAELRRQMSQLSPKAAEAIAAALDSLPMDSGL